jgi:hypothetical protein
MKTKLKKRLQLQKLGMSIRLCDLVPMNLISVVIRERNIGIITSFFEVKPVFLKPK